MVTTGSALSGLTLRHVAEALLAGLLAALVFHCVLIPEEHEWLRDLVAHFTACPLFLVGFRRGAPSIWLAAAVAALAVGVLLGLRWASASDGAMWSLIYFVLIAGPAAWVTQQTINNRPRNREPDPGIGPPLYRLLAFYVGGMVLLVLLWNLVQPHPADLAIIDYVKEYLVRLGVPELMLMVNPGLDAFDLDAEVYAVATLYGLNAPGIVIAGLLTLGIMNLRLVQPALARRGIAQRPRLDLLDIPVPVWVAIAFAVGIVAIKLGQGTVLFLGLGLAWSMTVPLLMGGFATLNLTLRGRGFNPRPALTLITLLTILLVLPLALILALGFVDAVLHLRRSQRRRISQRYAKVLHHA